MPTPRPCARTGGASCFRHLLPMTNRLKKYFGEEPDPEPAKDFFRVISGVDDFAVSAEVAAEIERALDHRPPPHWVTFTDLSGARHRILASTIKGISESTVAQRQAEREFRRARRDEEKADRRPWDDDLFF